MDNGPRGRRLRELPSVLDRTLELKHRYIDCFPPSDDPYDTLLDDFEPGMKTDEVRRVFDRLKPALRDLVAAARGRGARGVRQRLVPGERAARALARRRPRLRHRRAVLPPRPDRSSVLHLVRNPRHPADDAIRRERPPRELAVLDDARGRAWPLRARRRARARPDTARDRLFVRAPRVAEPALGERDRALAPVLAMVLPAVPATGSRARSETSRSSVSPRDQPRAAVA